MTKTSKPTSASRPRLPAPRPRQSQRRKPLPPLDAVLVAFADLAKRLDLRWYVFGAQAVNLHGFPRTTADVDVTVDLGALTPRAMVIALERAGFTPRFADDAFIAATRVIPVVHGATRFPMDVVLAGPGLEQQFLAEVEHRRLARRSIPILSLENLIVAKLVAGRPKDLEDVRELVAMHRDGLDAKHVRDLLKQLLEVVDDSRLLARFDKLLAEPAPRARRK